LEFGGRMGVVGKKKEKMGGILKNEMPGKQQRKKILWVMCPLIALKG
jgi:hypothetical protein